MISFDASQLGARQMDGQPKESPAVRATGPDRGSARPPSNWPGRGAHALYRASHQLSLIEQPRGLGSRNPIS